MSLGYDRPLYILAFDHRTSFQTKLFGIAGTATSEQRERMTEAKHIILDGLFAVAGETPADSLGALTDEELGATAARDTKARGLKLAMSAEMSSQAEFQFEYGDDFAAHIEAFEPDFVKVLVRYNPEGDRELNARQAARLATLSEWLAPRETKYLFELIVAPEPAQLADLGGDADRFVTEVRPRLTVEAIRALQAAGVEPDVWKVEGLDTVADYELVAEAARAGGRDNVGCVVLGAGADEATVAHWLRGAAAAEGFIGFAIGRTIFWEAISGWNAGTTDRDTAVEMIAANYRSSIDTYTGAAQVA
jgi:myo-inositol catabolism protein IolC